MRRIALFAVICLAGCRSTTTGPLANKTRTDKADDPLYAIDEQQKRGRDRYAYPDDGLAPSTLTNRYGTLGR